MVQAHIAPLPRTREDFHFLREHEPYFTENYVKIVDKSQNEVDFRRNAIQRAFDEAETGRDVIVKPAQVGFTSRLVAKILHRTLMIPNTTSVIVAYNEYITQRLLTKAQAFFDSLPIELQHTMHHRSSHEKLFKDINSVLYIGSAQSFTFARGEAIHNFLADEYAFWDNPERILGPAQDRVVPASQGGRLWVLSTPNGMDNPFYEIYNNAKGPQSPFTAHFYPWYMHEEYQLARGHPDALESDRYELSQLDSDELLLLEQGVTEDQLRWRRLKIAEKESLRQLGKTRVLFQQEYPADDVTCFLTAGDMAYDADLLQDKAKRCTEPLVKAKGLWIWEQAQAGHRYHMAVDPGLGKQTKTAVTVWRFWEDSNYQPRGALCAALCELLDIEATARRIEEIALQYNLPRMAIEVNGHGIGLIHELDTRYHGCLYYREDLTNGRISQQKGWLTTAKTKPAMIKETMKVLPYLEIPDIRIISEMQNIREDNNRRDIYISLGPDDLHDSTAIAVITREQGNTKYSMDSYGW